MADNKVRLDNGTWTPETQRFIMDVFEHLSDIKELLETHCKEKNLTNGEANLLVETTTEIADTFLKQTVAYQYQDLEYLFAPFLAVIEDEE